MKPAAEAIAPPLYPDLDPFRSGRLKVSPRHTIHFEESGNAGGFPVLFLHGGPGSHTRPLHRRFFDPRCYRIVLFDQRGCGQSAPLGCVEENTTQLLVDDIEALRRHLALDRLMLFGGSWGCTLALAYATAYPERVAAVVLRGVFLGSRAEVAWYLGGLRNFIPEAWEALAQGRGDDLLTRYHALVNEGNERDALAAARRWVAYEDAVMSLHAQVQPPQVAPDPAALHARARIQLHYLVHDCFLEPGQLASGLPRLARTRSIIVQGRLDMACPPRTAVELARALPHAELLMVERGGHSATEPDMASALRRATDRLRDLLGGRGT